MRIHVSEELLAASAEQKVAFAEKVANTKLPPFNNDDDTTIPLMILMKSWSTSRKRSSQTKKSGEKGVLCKSLPLWLMFLLLTATMTAICGSIIVLFLPDMFKQYLFKQLMIEEGTIAHKEWMQSSVPVFTRMFLFSIENPREFLVGGAKPVLTEMGPYTFREREIKEDVVWNDNNETVTYRVRKSWFFEPSLSNGNLSDLVTTINLPMIASTQEARDNIFLQWGLSSTLETIGSRPWTRKTVGELLFDGYEDTLLSLAEWFAPDEAGMPVDRFGWFYKRNGTKWADGTYNMHTGASNLNDLGKIGTWNFNNRTHFAGECGAMRGSASGLFPPRGDLQGDLNANVGQNIYLFSHEACRTLKFSLIDETEVESIRGVEYGLDETNFANGTLVPDNACFENNLPTGLQNSTRCKAKSPAFLSHPHFFQADPVYVEQFAGDGVAPDADKHRSKIVLEPMTGIPLEVLIRLQINIRLDPVEGISLVEKVPSDFYLPVIWFEAHARVSPAIAASINLVLDLPRIVRICGLSVSIAGVTILIVGLAVSFVRSQGLSNASVSDNQKGDATDDHFKPMLHCHREGGNLRVLLTDADDHRGVLEK